MIDFANTIRANNDESSSSSNHHHHGPDKGYLYGLERLIGIFRGILNDSEIKQQ